MLFWVVPTYSMVLNSFRVSTAKRDHNGTHFFFFGGMMVKMHHLELSAGKVLKLGRERVSNQTPRLPPTALL